MVPLESSDDAGVAPTPPGKFEVADPRPAGQGGLADRSPADTPPAGAADDTPAPAAPATPLPTASAPAPGEAPAGRHAEGGAPERSVEEIRAAFQRLVPAALGGAAGFVAPEVRRFLQETRPQIPRLPEPLRSEVWEFACFWYDYVGELSEDFLQSPAAQPVSLHHFLPIDDYELLVEKPPQTRHRRQERLDYLANQQAVIQGDLARSVISEEDGGAEAGFAFGEPGEIEGTLEALAGRTAHLAVLEGEVKRLSRQRQELAVQLKGLDSRLAGARKELAEAERAQHVVEQAKTGYEACHKAVLRLGRYGKPRQGEDELKASSAETEQRLATVSREVESLEQTLAGIAVVERRVRRLKSRVDKQEQLEADLERARQDLAHWEALHQQMLTEQARQEELSAEQQRLLEVLTARGVDSIDLSTLGKQRRILEKELARLEKERPRIERRRQRLQQRLDKVGDPRSEYLACQTQVEKRSQVEAELAQARKGQKRLQREKTKADGALLPRVRPEDHADLLGVLAAQQADYQRYLENMRAARTLSQRRTKHASLQADREKAQAEWKQVAAELREAEGKLRKEQRQLLHEQEGINEKLTAWGTVMGPIWTARQTRRQLEARWQRVERERGLLTVLSGENPPGAVAEGPGASGILRDFHNQFYRHAALEALEREPGNAAEWRRYLAHVRPLGNPEARALVPLQVQDVVRDRLAAILNQGILSPQERCEAGDILGCLGGARSGDPRPGTGTRPGGRVESSSGGADTPQEHAGNVQVPDILWVQVPAGAFPMGTADGRVAHVSAEPGHTVQLPTYYISRYPITNAQYRVFVEAGGYDEPRYWTPEGWDWRTGEWQPDKVSEEALLQRERRYWCEKRPADKRRQPLSLDNPILGIPNRPVTGVTWFEATAYCRWLTEVLGFDVQGPGQVAPADRGAISVWHREAREGKTFRLWPPGEDTGVGLVEQFAHWQAGLSQLLVQMGPSHPRYAEALALQPRLGETINRNRQRGDIEAQKAERADILAQLNELTLSTLGRTFADLCASTAVARRIMSWRILLPSEAEWEKAARGGRGFRWPWGDKWAEDHANTEEAEICMASAVGCFPEGAAEYGCLDMVGNVWEWTRSKWGRRRYPADYHYPYRADDGREDPGGPDLRVVRGGSWINTQEYARCAYRFWRLPERADSFLGFRVVLLQAFDDQVLPRERHDRTVAEIQELVRVDHPHPDDIGEALQKLAGLEGHEKSAEALTLRLERIRGQQQMGEIAPKEVRSAYAEIAREILNDLRRPPAAMPMEGPGSGP